MKAFLAKVLLVGFSLVLVTTVAPPSPASANHEVPVTLTITEVLDVDDEGDALSDADMYAEVTINGVVQDSFASHQDGEEHIFPNWVFVVNVPEGQATTDVRIIIWEHEDCDDRCDNDQQFDVDPTPAGRVLDLVVDIEKGTWTGDTTGTCAQGDHEDLPAKVCFSIDTLSATVDGDGDGLRDSWETGGIDANDDGTIDLDLPSMGADANQADLFVEIDYMEFHRPKGNAIQDVVDAFAAAPVPNSNGIDLHVDVDEQVTHDTDLTTWGEFDAIKASSFGTAADRADPNSAAILAAKRLVYRYSLWGHGRDGGGSSGLAEDVAGANDFIVTLGVGWTLNDAGTHNVGSRQEQAGTFMHELGHTLGLGHGGGDGSNCKPNYLSIMSYSFQTGGIPGPGSTSRLDYSREDLDDLDENAADDGVGLDEPAGIGDGSDITIWQPGDGGAPLSGAGNGPLDWNGDDDEDDNDVTADINATGFGGDCLASPGETLAGFDDWENLDFNFRNNAGFADGAHPAVVIPELDAVETAAIRAAWDGVLGPNADAGGPYSSDEGQSVSFDGTASSDPDDAFSTLQFRWTFGDGTTATGSKPLHTYGDDGVFTVTLTVTDPAGRSDTATTTATVANVDPTAVIAGPNATVVNGGATIVAHVGDSLLFEGNSKDPGSDDLTLGWDFGDDTPVVSTTHLVNPPSTDPDPSPTVQPRDVTSLQAHTFGAACAYVTTLSAADDDGGSSSDNANVLITGNTAGGRQTGYWQHQYRRKGATDFDDATLQCYLDIVDYVSQVFHQTQDASTFQKAHAILFEQKSGVSKQQLLDRALLTAWLNFANGAVEYDELVDTDGDGTADTSFATAMAEAEAIRLSPAATAAQLDEQRAIVVRINDVI